MAAAARIRKNSGDDSHLCSCVMPRVVILLRRVGQDMAEINQREGQVMRTRHEACAQALIEKCNEIGQGLSFNKSPEVYGAFPTSTSRPRCCCCSTRSTNRSTTPRLLRSTIGLTRTLTAAATRFPARRSASASVAWQAISAPKQVGCSSSCVPASGSRITTSMRGSTATTMTAVSASRAITRSACG